MIVGSARDMALLIRNARQQRGMTQGALAAAIGMTRQAVSSMEAGRTIPSVAVALAALDALDLQVDVVPQRQQAGARPITQEGDAADAGAPLDLDAVLAAIRDGEVG